MPRRKYYIFIFIYLQKHRRTKLFNNAEYKHLGGENAVSSRSGFFFSKNVSIDGTTCHQMSVIFKSCLLLQQAQLSQWDALDGA